MDIIDLTPFYEAIIEFVNSLIKLARSSVEAHPSPDENENIIKGGKECPKE